MYPTISMRTCLLILSLWEIPLWLSILFGGKPHKRLSANVLLRFLLSVGCTKACAEALTLNKLLYGCIPDPRSAKRDTLPKSFSKNYFELLAQRTGHEWYGPRYTLQSYQTNYSIKGCLQSRGLRLENDYPVQRR